MAIEIVGNFESDNNYLIYDKTLFTTKQLEQIFSGLENGVEIITYMKPELDLEKKAKIQQQLDEAFNKPNNFNLFE